MGRYVAARAFRAFVVRRGFRADGRDYQPGEVCPEAETWPTVRALVGAGYLVVGAHYHQGQPVEDAGEWPNVDRLVQQGFLAPAGKGARGPAEEADGDAGLQDAEPEGPGRAGGRRRGGRRASGAKRGV